MSETRKIVLTKKKSTWVPDLGFTFYRNEPKDVPVSYAKSLVAQGIYEYVDEDIVLKKSKKKGSE